MEKYLRSKIGELTKEEFMAVKEAMGHKLLRAHQLDTDKIMVVDEFGIENKIDKENIRDAIGHTVKVRATVSPMNSQKQASGSLTIENVNDAHYDPDTGWLMIDADKFCLSSSDCSQEMRSLGLLIASPECWVTMEALSIIIPENATWDDFKSALENVREREDVEKEFEELHTTQQGKDDDLVIDDNYWEQMK